MLLSDLIRTLSQAGQRATAPAARQQYKARSPWGQRVQQRQAQLIADMKSRQQQRAQAQERYQNQMRSYKTNLADYTQRRKAAVRSDSSIGASGFTSPFKETLIERKIGARPTMPTEPTTSTANVIKQRYQRPKRKTSSTRSWRNTRSTMPTGNRQFLRGVKFE